jgi:hypothetical protein
LLARRLAANVAVVIEQRAALGRELLDRLQASLLGRTWPFSHRLTVEKVTLSAWARPSWVK